jgi:hypothetical protein
VWRYILVSIAAAAALSAQDQNHPHSLGKFLRYSFDHRFRFEDYRALRYNEGNNDHWLLHRIRMNLSVLPTPWLAVHLQAQDSRVFFKGLPTGASTYINRTDLRMAYADIGKGQAILRVGRQELAYGEDRLLGAANWGNVARTFDAVKLLLTRGPVKLDLFAASVVRIEQRGISQHQQGNNLHGAYMQWKGPLNGATIEPYFYWRVGPSTRGHQDRRVAALRWIGPLPWRLDYSTETVQQTGSVGDKTVRAFATHLVLRYSFKRGKWKPRLSGEYNFASGDGTPNNRTDSTFDQIYPTPHNKTGLADQIGWVNLHNLASTFDFTPWRKLVIRVNAHDWRLAQAKDGVYLVNGTLVFRDLTGQSGTHVGRELDVLATWQTGPNTFSGGYGHIFPGEFLRKFSRGNGLHYFYLNVGYRF